MPYEILVCDYTAISEPYAVSVNNALVYEHEDKAVCQNIAKLMKQAYNQGLRDMMMKAQESKHALEMKNERLPSQQEEYVHIAKSDGE